MKGLFLLPFFLLVLAAFIYLPAKDPTFAAEAEVSLTTQVYKEIENYQLKAYVFSPKDLPANEKRPAFLFFHGGGWNRGTPQESFDICRQIAPKGWIVITFEYRLCINDSITPVECIKDAKSAVRWVRANAETLHISPDKIVASGTSAGGHLAASTSMIAGINESNDNLKISAEPNALVLYFPCVNTDADDWFKKLLHHKLPVEETSPFHQLKAGLPPTVICHGTKDETVPYRTVVEFQQKMTQFGNHCTLYTFESNHNLFLTDAAEIFRLTTKFLTNLGWTNIPEKNI
jgi:acetyl esterase